MTLPLLGTVELVPYAAGTNPSQPAVCVLPDDTVLLAWQYLTTGAITIRRYTRDLSTVTAEATVAASSSSGIWQRGMALFPNGDGATLAADNRVFTVSPALAVAQVGAYDGIYWARGASTMLTLDDGASAQAADNEVIVHRGGTLTRHAAPSTVTSLYPADDGSVYVATTFGSRVDVYRMDTSSGATTLVESGPHLDIVYHGPGRPGAYPTMPRNATLALFDTAGDVVSDSGWPSAAAWQQSAYVGSAPHPDEGWVSAWWAIDWDTETARVGVAHDQGGTITAQDLPHPNLHGLLQVGWAQSPVVATNGRTAVIVLTGYQDRSIIGAPADTFGITAWTVEVGTDALLHVAHQDGTWRKVGDESWADGPGRMLLGVPRSLSPSGWVMEVKPGDDTTNARTMHLDMPGGAEREAPVRMIPWPGV